MPRATELPPRELPTDAEAGAGQPPRALLTPEAVLLPQRLVLPPSALAAVSGDVQLPGSGGAEAAAAAAAGAGAGGDPEVEEDVPAAAGDVVLEGLLGFVGAAVGPALLG